MINENDLELIKTTNILYKHTKKFNQGSALHWAHKNKIVSTL